jgi:transmembrane sensor
MKPVFQNSTIDEIAAQWVARRDAGLSASDEAEFREWCGVEAHRDALARFETLWAVAGRPRRTGEAVVLERRVAALRTSRSRRRVAMLAAVTALTIAGWIGWQGRAPVSPDTFAPATATLILPQHQVLPDGTRVDFPFGTELAVDFTGAARRVRLVRGEAHFAVAKDPAWPFIVEAGGVEFRAVGTTFSVQLNAQSAQLLVTEGRVAVEKQGVPVAQSQSIGVEPLGVIEAGRRVLVDIAAEPTATEVAPMTEGEIGERLAWRNPRAEFSGTSLREVVELLNRQNRTQLVISDASLSDVQLSGVFRLDDVESVVRSLEVGFGVVTERADGRVLLRRAPVVAK